MPSKTIPANVSMSTVTPPTSANGPGMYIGDTGPKGLHHLVYELVANSVDEALAGFCKHIHVRINADGSLSVSDDGRGIPVEEHPEEKLSTLEVVMTMVGAGGQVRQGHLQGLGRLARHGRQGGHRPERVDRGQGASQRPDLSPGVRARQGDDRGQGIGRLKQTGTRSRSSRIRRSSSEITFDYETLESRLRELAFLNKGLAISLHDERTGKEELFKYEGGMAEFVEYINRTEDALHETIYFEKTVGRRSRSKWPCSTRRGEEEPRPLLHQQRLQLDRRHAPDRLPHGPDAAR